MGGFLGLGVGPDVNLNPIDAAQHAFEWGKDRLGDVGDWGRHHWKTIVAIGVGVIVTAAVFAVVVGSGGTAAPGLLLLAGAAGTSGFAGGASTELTSDLLNDKKPGLDVLESGAIGGVTNVLTLGAGRLVGPLLPEVASRFLPGAAAAAEDGAAPSIVQIFENGLKKPPVGGIWRLVTDGGSAAVSNGAGVAAPPAVKHEGREICARVERSGPPPTSVGFTRLVERECGGATPGVARPAPDRTDDGAAGLATNDTPGHGAAPTGVGRPKFDAPLGGER